MAALLNEIESEVHHNETYPKTWFGCRGATHVAYLE